jgi:hypothetical protein
MNIKSQFLDHPNFKTNMNTQNFFFFFFFYYYFFFQKQKLGPSVCKCVPHTPKLKLHIVPNVYIMERSYPGDG